MAAPLQTLDQIRDSLVSRGIGNSGLTTQAIQRANLPELSTSLATATAIRRTEEQRRESSAKAKQLSQISSALRQSIQSTNITNPQALYYNRGQAGVAPYVVIKDQLGERSVSPTEALNLGINLAGIPSFSAGNLSSNSAYAGDTERVLKQISKGLLG